LLKEEEGKTAEQGARVIFHVAAEDIKGQSGTFWANRSIYSREKGEARPHWYGEGLDLTQPPLDQRA
jgi:hypothetical protein